MASIKPTPFLNEVRELFGNVEGKAKIVKIIQEEEGESSPSQKEEK